MVGSAGNGAGLHVSSQAGLSVRIAFYIIYNFVHLKRKVYHFNISRNLSNSKNSL